MADAAGGSKRHADGDAKGGNKRQKRDKRDGKQTPRGQIDFCAKNNDLLGAMRVFRESLKTGGNLQSHSCNVLLHLCSQRASDAPEEEKAELGDNPSQEVYDYMDANKVEPTEMTFTALARCAALRGDGAAAFAWVQKMKEKGIEPKLRSYNPALQAHCEKKQLAEANAVYEAIKAGNYTLTESEYGLLLDLYTDVDAKDAAWALLDSIREDLRVVGDRLTESILAFFNKQGWAVQTGCTVNEDGVCSAAPEVQLQPVDLTDKEREELASGIAALAKQREREEDFDKFEAWLKETGPYDIIIDGANVGMHGQSFEGAQFNFGQVRRLLEELRASRAEDLKPPLLVLHERRVHFGPAKSNVNRNIIADWKQRGELHVTPAGSNDDWYWLYAAVVEKSSVLITNDELRDHIFQMLPSPKLFYRWKMRHQVRFRITPTTVALDFPPAFTMCIQRGTDWWMFPTGEGDEYIMARKQGA